MNIFGDNKKSSGYFVKLPNHQIFVYTIYVSGLQLQSNIQNIEQYLQQLRKLDKKRNKLMEKNLQWQQLIATFFEYEPKYQIFSMYQSCRVKNILFCLNIFGGNF
jgi:hypothetical protein